MVTMEYCVIIEKERGETIEYEIIREKGRELPIDLFFFLGSFIL